MGTTHEKVTIGEKPISDICKNWLRRQVESGAMTADHAAQLEPVLMPLAHTISRNMLALIGASGLGSAKASNAVARIMVEINYDPNAALRLDPAGIAASAPAHTSKAAH